MGRQNRQFRVWMPFYIGDYAAGTMHLSTVQHGAYFLLICAYWRQGGALPDDDARLANIARLPEGEWQAHRQVISEFFTVRDGIWRHERIEEELKKAADTQSRLSKRGRSAAESRWQHKGDGMLDVCNKHTSGIAQALLADAPSQSQSPKEYIHGASAELPPNFPKNERAAIEQAPPFLQAEREFVLDTYHKAASRGGRDARDIPVRNWSSFLAIEWKYAQNRETEQQARSRNGGTAKPKQPAKTDAEILKECL